MLIMEIWYTQWNASISSSQFLRSSSSEGSFWLAILLMMVFKRFFSFILGAVVTSGSSNQETSFSLSRTFLMIGCDFPTKSLSKSFSYYYRSFFAKFILSLPTVIVLAKFFSCYYLFSYYLYASPWKALFVIRKSRFLYLYCTSFGVFDSKLTGRCLN